MTALRSGFVALKTENSFKSEAPVYLQHEDEGKTMDYVHWQIHLGRRFRSLKLWLTMRMIGIEGLRHNIREGVARGKFFEQLVRSDERFEIVFPVTLGLVCFRLVTPNKSLQELNELNKTLSQRILSDRTFNVTSAEVHDVYFLRVSTGMSFCSNAALKEFWNLLQDIAQKILSQLEKN